MTDMDIPILMKEHSSVLSRKDQDRLYADQAVHLLMGAQQPAQSGEVNVPHPE